MLRFTKVYLKVGLTVFWSEWVPIMKNMLQHIWVASVETFSKKNLLMKIRGQRSRLIAVIFKVRIWKKSVSKHFFTKILIKIHVRRAAAEDILKFTCICVCLCMYLFIYVFVCVTSPGHTNNDTDLKFGTHTPIDLI